MLVCGVVVFEFVYGLCVMRCNCTWIIVTWVGVGCWWTCGLGVLFVG